MTIEEEIDQSITTINQNLYHLQRAMVIAPDAVEKVLGKRLSAALLPHEDVIGMMWDQGHPLGDYEWGSCEFEIRIEPHDILLNFAHIPSDVCLRFADLLLSDDEAWSLYESIYNDVSERLYFILREIPLTVLEMTLGDGVSVNVLRDGSVYTRTTIMRRREY